VTDEELRKAYAGMTDEEWKAKVVEIERRLDGFLIAWVILSILAMIAMLAGCSAGFHPRGTPGPKLLETRYAWSEPVPPRTPGAFVAHGATRQYMPRPWSRKEIAHAAMALACVLGDVATTEIGLRQGGREANPLLSSRPLLWGTHLLAPIIVWWYGERMGSRVPAWLGLAVPMCAVTAWNATQLKED